MKETKLTMIMRLIISNAVAVFTFFGLYKFGIAYGIASLEKFYIIPLIALVGIIASENQREIQEYNSRCSTS